MIYGWMGKIADIDLTTGKVDIRDTTPYAHDYIGGRALAARIAWDEIPKGIDAYDPANRIIIATGPLFSLLKIEFRYITIHAKREQGKRNRSLLNFVEKAVVHEGD